MSTVTYDNDTQSLQLVTTNTTTFAHTCTGTELALVVVVVLSGTGQTVSSVKYNTVDLSFIGATNSTASKQRNEVWGMVGPATGAHNVVVTLSANNAAWDVSALSVTGADQTGGATTFNGYTQVSDVGNDNPVTTTVTSATTDDLVVHLGQNVESGTMIGNSGTLRWSDTSGATNTLGATSAGSASPVTISVDFTGASTEAGRYLVGGLNITHAAATCVITGTVTDTIDEDDIVAGGKTIIATLTGGAAYIADGTADLSFAHGAIQWLAADAATATYTVSGLSFAPKAIRFYWMGIKNTGTASTDAVNERRGVGFAVSTSSRRAIGTFSQDTPITSNCGAAARDDCVACTTDGAAASDGRLDITSFDSGGFVLTVDDATPADITVFWEAWGGAEITVAVVGDIAEPAATGAQAITATGFVAGATDQVVMFAGCQCTAVNTDLADSSSLSIGFATSGDDAQNINIMGSSDDASTAMDTDGRCYTGQCHSMIILAGAATVNAAAKLTAFTTDGFTLTWASRATTGRCSAFMAIKGGHWQAGAYTIAGNSGSATATVSGLTFVPQGASFMGRMTAIQSATATTANDRIGLGTGTSTSSRRSMGVLDEDATVSSVAEIDVSIDYEACLCFPSTSGTLQAAYDINAWNSDGFQIIVDTAGGVASEWQGYLTFGRGVYFSTSTVVADVIAGLDSAQSETHGWDADVKAALGAGNIVRTSATVMTITLPAVATYNITAQETITVTVPTSILV